MIAILGVKPHGMHRSPGEWLVYEKQSVTYDGWGTFIMVGKSHVQSWATAISTNSQNGRKIIFRYAKDFSATFDRASQPSRIIIVWKYDSESGQPGPEEHRRMNLLEDLWSQFLVKITSQF
jgi:hypothetical protein